VLGSGPIRTYDYQPFGELLTSSTGTAKCQGFNEREKDRENEYFNNGPESREEVEYP